MQTIFIFIVYFFLFNWIIISLPFIKNCGLGKWWLAGLFSSKVFAGLAYGWFYLQPAYNTGSDTWHFFDLSKGETDWLLNDPVAFFKDLFVYGYDRSGNLFLGDNSYWNDLKSNVVIKLLAICNVFTFKNYFADVIFFNFLFFFGPIALYKVVSALFNSNKALMAACIFLIPSFVFWCSGIHKDGLIFTCTGMTIYCFYKQLSAQKVMMQYVLQMVLYCIILFALRNFMALLLFFAILVWFVTLLFPGRTKLLLSLIFTCSCIVFFVSGRISRSTDLPGYVIQKQDEFKQLSGTSMIPVPPLENTPQSFIKFLPAALDIALFRPHISEIKNKSYVPAITEIMIFWFVILLSLFIKNKIPVSAPQSAFLVFCFIFAFSFLLLAGYTITFSGAIVRYRACVLPFLFIFILQKLSQLKNPFKKFY